MASGYLTSDGKDLDARYLGINSKAKSAVTADTASSVEWSGVTSKPNLFPKVNWSRATVKFSSTAYTAPENGLVVVYKFKGGAVAVNTKTVAEFSATTTLSIDVDRVTTSVTYRTAFYVAKGDSITGQTSGEFYYLA